MTGAWRSVETIHEGYGDVTRAWRQPLPGTAMAAALLSAVLGVWTGALVAVVVAAGALTVAAVVVDRRVRPVAALLVVAVGVAGAARGSAVRSSLAPDRLGAFEGWVTVIDDPAARGAATRVVVEVDGERYEVWVRGRAMQMRAQRWRAGEQVMVAGERVPLAPSRARRVAWQHVVGELRLDWVGDVAPGAPLARAANRARSLIERGAAALAPVDAALLRGLVVGDDRDQPAVMVERFRASGLSHLTAVSGQNVALMIAVAGPLLRRLRPGPRWAATLALVAWFVVLTRFEPSILRAGAMAALSATAFALGRERAPARLLAVAVTGLVLVDPLLVSSVGFWLSVGATAGVCVAGPPLSRALGVAGPLAGPLGVTLGAQVGVLVPSVVVFGGPPLVSLPANLLAVPVAGFVMLYGLPATLVAGLTVDASPSSARAILLPATVGVRWIDTVAALGEQLEPPPPWRWIGWMLVAGAVLTTAVSQRRRRPVCLMGAAARSGADSSTGLVGRGRHGCASADR